MMSSTPRGNFGEEELIEASCNVSISIKLLKTNILFSLISEMNNFHQPILREDLSQKG
jgi:hypothetical protein